MATKTKSLKPSMVAPSIGPSVTCEFARCEEKMTCWSYVRGIETAEHPQLFVGDYIYVRKALFHPSAPPLKLRVTVTVVS